MQIIRHEQARSSALITCVLSHFLNIHECVDSFFKFVSKYWDDVAKFPRGPLDLFGPAFDALSQNYYVVVYIYTIGNLGIMITQAESLRLPSCKSHGSVDRSINRSSTICQSTQHIRGQLNFLALSSRLEKFRIVGE